MGTILNFDEFVNEQVGGGTFQRTKLKYGCVCFSESRPDLAMIWIPKDKMDIIKKLYDVPDDKYGFFLHRNIYNKGQFMITPGSAFNSNLVYKGMKRKSIVKISVFTIPQDALESKNMVYDFESSLDKFLKENGDNFYERTWETLPYIK